MSQHFDLNLLKVLAVLLEEKSVTKTAERLFVTQSAVSKHLSRLREMFDDPLLVRSGKTLVATPKALELSFKIKPLLQDINSLTQSEIFCPSKCDRVFRFDMMEIAYSVTLPEVMPKILDVAPLMKLDLQTWNEKTYQRLKNCEIDFAVRCLEQDPRSANHIKTLPADLEFAELSQDRAVCVVRKDHPILSKGFTLKGFMEQKHIQVTGGGTRHWLLDEVLMQKGLQRDFVIEMPDFQGAFRLCQRTDLVLCVPYRQVQSMIDSFGLEVIDIPIEMKCGIFVLIWNKYFNEDHAHKWMREHIVSTMKKANVSSCR